MLATDPDREGEAISWHVLQELQVAPSAQELCCFTVGGLSIASAARGPLALDHNGLQRS